MGFSHSSSLEVIGGGSLSIDGDNNGLMNLYGGAKSSVRVDGAGSRVDVAGSIDDTGNTRFGGDWILEFATGTIETENPFSNKALADWYGKLAVIVVTTFNDVVNAGDGLISLREAIIQVNAGSGGDTIELAVGTYVLSRTGTGENHGERD